MSTLNWTELKWRVMARMGCCAWALRVLTSRVTTCSVGCVFLSGCVMGVTQDKLCSKTDSATAAALRAHRRALSYTYVTLPLCRTSAVAVGWAVSRVAFRAEPGISSAPKSRLQSRISSSRSSLRSALIISAFLLLSHLGSPPTFSVTKMASTELESSCCVKHVTSDYMYHTSYVTRFLHVIA